MKLDESTEIVSLKMIDIDTHKEYEAKMKLNNRTGEPSRCHFFEDIETHNHIIRLRLDWSDVLNGEPTLDANILDKGTDKWIPIPKNEPSWHNTRKVLNSETDETLYLFEFEGYKARLTTVKNVNKYLHDTEPIKDELGIKIIRGDS